MSPAERDAFLATPRTAVLATVDGAGRPHAVAVWFRAVDGELRIVTARDSAKARNIARTGRAALCIDDRGGRPVSLTGEGPVTVAPLDPEERFALWAHYRGEEVARATVARGGHESMVLLTLRPERWY